ncbi:hypothetical protein HBB16_02240 [Pseudonocardia sp. MCCB 268]|nr:hypothetical protein [Pseudonocardia cytotoxica]
MPHSPRDSAPSPTPQGRAVFTVSPLECSPSPRAGWCCRRSRSHDQFNTTVYGLDDRYRGGVYSGRRVLFISRRDLAELGRSDGDRRRRVREWDDGIERRARRFRLVAYDTRAAWPATTRRPTR